MGAPSIATGRNVFQPISCAKARNGYLLIVDGLTRGLQWNGIDTSAQDIGIDAPSAAPTVGDSAGGAATAGAYQMAYRYKEVDGAITTYGNLTSLTALTVIANRRFDWSAIKQSGSTHTRPTHIELYRSTAGQSTTLYLVTTLTNTPGGGDATYTDTASDATISANASLAVLLPDGSLNARRFGVPPNYTPFIAQYQDRMWYCGRVKYTKGTVATNGTTTITGTSTDWTSAMATRYIIIDGEPAPLLISSASATSITTSVAATNTASGKSYVIVPSPLTRNQALFSEQDEPESVPSTNTVTIQENTGDEDELTGVMPYGSVLYFLKERHIYGLTFVRQPIIDSSVQLIASRGCVNNRSWVLHEGMAYLLDELGIYRFDGRSPTTISEPIQDLFKDGSLDWANKKWFFSGCDPVRSLIYFYVGFAADSSTRPKRALVWNTRTETWSVDKHVWEIGGGSIIRISNQARFLVGIENDIVLATGQGTSDVVAAVRGTATAGTTTTITDSTQAWSTNAYADAPVSVVAGTNKGYQGRISSNTGTVLTVTPAMDAAADTTTVYLIGGIQWNWKSGLFEFPRTEQWSKRSLRLVYSPTTNNNTLDASFFRNHEATAFNMRVAQNQGTGVTTGASSSRVVVDLKKTRSVLENDPGFKEFQFPGVTDDRGQMARWMSMELLGAQGQDAITLYNVELEGVAQ